MGVETRASTSEREECCDGLHENDGTNLVTRPRRVSAVAEAHRISTISCAFESIIGTRI